MSTTTTMMKTATKRHLLAALTAGLGLLALTETAQAQEILLTGPLAGAPAVRELRLYRQGRVEISPGVTFTVLDEYRRTIMPGLQLTYNITDWLGIGVWGAFGAIKTTTALTDHIQEVNAQRDCRNHLTTTDCRLTAVNLGQDFTQQIASIDWMVAPQVTFVPFRGKLSFFSKVYTDSEIFFFLGPGFIGLTERADCDKPGGNSGKPTCINSFATASRVGVTATFGLGLSFFVNKWNSLGLEYRAMPFAWNTGGFDTAGGGRDKSFPDGKVDGSDRKFIFNQLLTVRWNFYLPLQYRLSQ
jgi:outer membrane beta-barrel protein